MIWNREGQMPSSERRMIRGFLWLILGVCAILDAGLGEAAISGAGHYFFLDDRGNLVTPRGDNTLWVPIALFVVLQGLLVFALIRLRRPDADNAQRGLRPEPIQFEEVHGIPRLPMRLGARMVTLEDVNRLRDTEE